MIHQESDIIYFLAHSASVSLQFYFESFDFNTNYLYEETIMDFACEWGSKV